MTSGSMIRRVCSKALQEGWVFAGIKEISDGTAALEAIRVFGRGTSRGYGTRAPATCRGLAHGGRRVSRKPNLVMPMSSFRCKIRKHAASAADGWHHRKRAG